VIGTHVDLNASVYCMPSTEMGHCGCTMHALDPWPIELTGPPWLAIGNCSYSPFHVAWNIVLVYFDA
jgi:hypothetical protein